MLSCILQGRIVPNTALQLLSIEGCVTIFHTPQIHFLFHIITRSNSYHKRLQYISCDRCCMLFQRYNRKMTLHYSLTTLDYISSENRCQVEIPSVGNGTRHLRQTRLDFIMFIRTLVQGTPSRRHNFKCTLAGPAVRCYC